MDKYKIKDYAERLKEETTENAHKMLYMWIKQDVISLSEYQELVKNCSIHDVGTRLFGVYSPEEDLLAVHATEQGAEENKVKYEKHHREGFYVDYVMLQP